MEWVKKNWLPLVIVAGLIYLGYANNWSLTPQKG
jgi:hypothetical protein